MLTDPALLCESSFKHPFALGFWGKGGRRSPSHALAYCGPPLSASTETASSLSAPAAPAAPPEASTAAPAHTGMAPPAFSMCPLSDNLAPQNFPPPQIHLQTPLGHLRLVTNTKLPGGPQEVQRRRCVWWSEVAKPPSLWKRGRCSHRLTKLSKVCWEAVLSSYLWKTPFKR